MSSVAAAKRMKLLMENEQKVETNNTAESGFHSEIHFSSNLTSDFSLSVVKRKSPAPRRASLQQISLNSISNNTSSGYNSLFSSSSANVTNAVSLTSLGRTSRTPKKRKSEISESDENFYNSFQFVSPVKIRKRDAAEKNCAKLVLKEKCPSENVILCSTPIRTNNKANKNAKWGKFRSFHPEKFQIGKSLDDAEPIAKIVCTPPIKSLADDSINLSNVDFSNVSGNFIHSIQHDIPANLQNLWTDDIINTKSASHSVCSESGTESQVKSLFSSVVSTNSNERRQFFNGRTKLDIIGKLHAKNDIAVSEILAYLDAEALLSLSHVSKEYRNMIQTNKSYETKRQNYLKEHTAVKENKLPVRQKAFSIIPENENNIIVANKKKKKAFGHYNSNISMTKKKTPSPPQSPSSRRYNEMQKLIKAHKNLKFKHCPQCRKPATINTVKIRNSPRKKKPCGILKLSTSTGRIQKRTRATFLSKTSIPESFHEAMNSPPYVTITTLDDDLSRSPHRSSSCESPNSSGSDESCEIDEIYEYGSCTSAGCNFKFCIKCNCKYHPRRICADLSPPSPPRNHSKILAGTQANRKSLRRLINQY